jgi:uncharacterized protein
MVRILAYAVLELLCMTTENIAQMPASANGSLRIGVIGGGASGLVTAWLLEQNHKVTLIEKQHRLGGHAYTIDVEQSANSIPIDVGFEFFSDTMFPVLNRLLRVLGVATHRYAATGTVYSADNQDLVLMPPARNGQIIWSACRPAALYKLLRLRQVLNAAAPLVEASDATITLGKFVDDLKLSEPFKYGFLYPFLLAQWCVELEEFKTFAAHNVFKYTVMNRHSGITAPMFNEIIGGTRIYIQALTRALTRVQVKLGVNIRRITRKPDGFVVADSGGGSSTFDHLVIATGAHDANTLLADLDEAADLCRELRRIEYSKTTIAVHADRRFMPAQEKYWSVFNSCYNDTHSHNTIWKSWKSREPIFRSWLTYDSRVPEPTYGVVAFEHPKVNLEYYRAQGNLVQLQGQNNLWLAGVYMHDVDCHESAVVSAVRIAQRLVPTSANLGKLTAPTFPDG